MALIIDQEMKTGVIANSSYCKIESVTATRDEMNFYVGIYLNKESRIENKQPLETRSYSCGHDSNADKNSIRQGYEFLKTLSEYENAIDDLEY